MAVQKVIKGMSRRAILMYAELVTHSKWEVSDNECKALHTHQALV